MVNLPRLLTIEEAANAMHETITVSTLRAAIRGGRLPARKIGRRFYLTEGEIEGFIQCQGAESPPGSTTEPMRGNGSSETVAFNDGQGAALASVERLKRRSQNTLHNERCHTAKVQRIRAS